MSLPQFQQALLELYTKPDSLSEFTADPSHLFARYDLTVRERAALLELPQKNLKDFQRDLVGKRARVTEKILTFNPGRVVIAPYSKTGAPMMSWGAPRKSVEITPGMFLVLKSIAMSNEVLSVSSILRAYVAQQQHTRAYDAFKLTHLMYSKRLIGKEISVPA
jgi:hypothetical protein